MKSINDNIQEYRLQMQKGDVPTAYREILKYMLKLKTYFQKQYANLSLPGGLYQGYMDMTYFSIIPESLKSKKLKIAVVFIHEDTRFEVWLSGYNKNVQKKYLDLMQKKDLGKYRTPPSLDGYDSILEYTLVEDPDFDNQEELTTRIEKGVVDFIKDVEGLV
ncbi:hypothetical protein JW887_01695 [Candidatus Dojkabacteria bacterium]|nr:hypothetical protein [Candidatus Dojkabacteria bacterium]